MSSYHARLSPSSAHRWTECSASVGAQEGRPNQGTDASRFGTCAHQIHEECLLNPDRDLQSYLGREMWFGHGRLEVWREQWPHTDVSPDHVVVVTQEMLDGVEKSLIFIRQQVELFGG